MFRIKIDTIYIVGGILRFAQTHLHIEREGAAHNNSSKVKEKTNQDRKMNTDITASAKPEYPVIDRNPEFTKVVGNFNTLDYCRFITLTGVSVTVGYLSGIKPGIKGPSMVTGGLIGLMGGFMYAYQNSAGRLMGFFPNEGEVARYQKRGFSS
ncbi:NADH-ubiquinone oxidoreductase 20.9 kDa subunit [Populus trichocarpa]|nr:NADH-ubiquinone oxidoreductase 20.9 kDa subunit [Populus trichocarpa]